jgi:hypothetical protein
VEENRATWVLFGLMVLAERLMRDCPMAMRLCFAAGIEGSAKRRELAAAYHGSI